MKLPKVMFLLFAIVLSSTYSCNAINEQGESDYCNPPDSNIVKILGDTISDVLFNPKKVSVYRLQKVFDTTAVKTDDCEDFKRDSLLTILKPVTICVLDFVLLSDTANYETDSLLVRTQYYPRLEFEFQKKKEIVKIRISTTDYSWSIIKDNKRRYNFNYKDKYAVNRFCKIFNYN